MWRILKTLLAFTSHGDKNQNGTVVLDLMEEAKELGNDDENIVTRD